MVTKSEAKMLPRISASKRVSVSIQVILLENLKQMILLVMPHLLMIVIRNVSFKENSFSNKYLQMLKADKHYRGSGNL